LMSEVPGGAGGGERGNCMSRLECLRWGRAHHLVSRWWI
jgi:hypothetical protein